MNSRKKDRILLKKPKPVPAIAPVPEQMPAEKRKKERSSLTGIKASQALTGAVALLFVLISCTLVGTLMVGVNREFKELSQPRHEQEIIRFSNQMISFLHTRIQILKDYAKLPFVYERILAPDETLSSQERSEALPVIGKPYKMVILDLDGNVVYATRTFPEIDYAGSAWFQSRKNDSSDHYTTIFKDGRKSYLRMAVPVSYQETVIGHLLLEMPSQELQDNLALTTTLEPSQFLQLYNDLLVALLGSDSASTVEYSSASLIQPLQDNYSPQDSVLNQLYKELALSTAAILLCIAFISTRLIKSTFAAPLERLREMTTELTSDNEALPVEINSRIREIKMLSRDFRLMAKTINHREKELQASRDHLEQRVIERTLELNESNQHLKSILGTIQSGIMVVDPIDHLIIEANKACCDMLGVTNDEIKGSSCKSFTSCSMREDNECCLTQEILASNEECTLTTANGVEITALKTVAPMMHAGREHILISFVDITDRKKVQIALDEARRKEVHLAAHIQETLLVGAPPNSIGNLKIDTLNIPSQTVSGDFFDCHCWSRSPNSLDIIIGDVMGKGINAALLGAGVKTAWHQALVSALEDGGAFVGLPATNEIVHQLHLRIVPELIAFEAFITLCYARLNTVEQQLEFVHCGHTEIIHWNDFDKRCSLLQGSSPPMGMLAEESYKTSIVSFNANDCFLFFSDGITEAENKDGEMFGIERLCRLLEHLHLKSVEVIQQVIRNTVINFCGTDQFSDDISCIAIKVEAYNRTIRKLPGIGLGEDIPLTKPAE